MGVGQGGAPLTKISVPKKNLHMYCKVCGLEHRGWVPCAKAKLVANKIANDPLVVNKEDWVANGPKLTVAIKLGVSQPLVPEVGVGEAVADRRDGQSRHGKYADLEARKAYMREYMRKRRASQPH